MEKKRKDRKKCSKCQKDRDLTRGFYLSNSNNHADKRINICKQCIMKDLNTKDKTKKELLSDEFLVKLQDVLLDMNRPYIHDVWISSVEEGEETNKEPFGILLKNLNLNHLNKNWRDSEFKKDIVETELSNSNSNKKRVEEELDIELNTQNEKDVLRLLGYDPFEFESERDRTNLFNKLIDYLDESTLEDGFRLTSSIEIVRTFNQIDKINASISKVFSNGSSDVSGVTSLVNAKDKLMSSILKIAQENGISVRHATNKSQGAGTLSGIINQLRDFDFNEADTNLYDIEMAKGIQLVADISNKNIAKQLKFDENDYSEMLLEQRELISEFERRAKKYEEENRLLRIELNERLKKEKELEEKIADLRKRR